MAEAQASSATIKFDEPAPQPLIVKATNGSPVVSALLKSIKELKSYRFHAVMRAVKDGKFKDSNATIYFKDPNLMCVEVGGHGPKAGSKLIRNAKGTIRFKGGPALFGITMTMQPDSRLLRLPSGQLVTECDYLSLFQGLAKEMSAGLKVTASPSPISLDHEPGQAIILETQEAGQNASFVRERILIDPKTSVPILWVRFKDGRLIASVKFEDLRLNLDVGNDMFNF
jgi:outer membrane lipoprotein-sorting protein